MAALPDDLPPEGVILPLDVVPSPPATPIKAAAQWQSRASEKPYSAEKQRDYVRLTVTVGLLVILAYLVVFASIESASWPAHWQQTKEMLQIILPAITGIIGTVIGFYFGTTAANGSQSSSDDAGS